jgi:UDP-N-acetyl-D-mannosaminuronic acid dehydrogenase
MFAEQGFDVIGVDILKERVDKINAGVSPIEGEEPGLADLLAEVITGGNLRATVDYEDLRDRDVILIDVETPIDKDNGPRYQALRNSLRSLGPVMKEGALVVVESTIAPGTIDNVVAPRIERFSGYTLNEGFYLGHCPERVMPGKLLANLRNLSRVVGGKTSETSVTMLALYKNIVQGDLDPADCITGELVKTAENAYRDVQIAFANEVAMICEAVGGDVWKVRELVNKSPGRQMLLPGAGVGGHCIPKDPWLLAYGAKEKNVNLNLIPAARKVNDSMPMHMIELLQEALDCVDKDAFDTRILIMGYAYLEESDDTRNSPSEVVFNYLRALGTEVVVHDPYVPGYDGDLLEMAAGCDAALVMVKHSMYSQVDLDALKAALRTPILIDGRRVYELQAASDAGIIYRGIGQPIKINQC